MYDDKYIFKRAFILEILNLHPVIVWGMVAIDILLFAAELFTFGLSFFLTIIISFLFGIFTIYVQMMACGDEFSIALGKGIISAIIILAPTNLLTLMFISLYCSKKRKMEQEKSTDENSDAEF